MLIPQFIDTLLATREHSIRWASAALPSFHTLAVFMQLYAPLASGEFVGLYTPQAPAPPVVPTPQNVLDVARITQSTGILSIPAFIEVCDSFPILPPRTDPVL